MGLIDRLNRLDERLGLVRPGQRTVHDLPRDVQRVVYRRHWQRAGLLALATVLPLALVVIALDLPLIADLLIVGPVIVAFNVVTQRAMARDVRDRLAEDDRAREPGDPIP